MPVREAFVEAKRSPMLLGAGGGVSKPRLSIGRSVLCIVGEPTGIGLAVDVCGDGVEATGSVGLLAPLLLIGIPPPDMVENPVAVGSGPFTVAAAGVIVAAVPAVAGMVVVLVVLFMVIAEFGVVATRLLLLWQQSQPARAIPAHAAPISPITGFLPIGSPFPRRYEPRARQPLRGCEVGGVTRIQSSPVLD